MREDTVSEHDKVVAAQAFFADAMAEGFSAPTATRDAAPRYPHPQERWDVETFAAGAGPRRVRAVLLAWRAGYQDADDPHLTPWSRLASWDGGTNFSKPIGRAYRAGFQARRDELLALGRFDEMASAWALVGAVEASP